MVSNLQARTIYFSMYKKGNLTVHQMIVVRKALAYAYELVKVTRLVPSKFLISYFLWFHLSPRFCWF
jgi:hypothetical protein